jgi:hypothetical protein
LRPRAFVSGHELYPREMPMQVLVKKSGRAALLLASIVLVLAISQRFAAAAPAQLPKLPSSFVVAVAYADTEGRGIGSETCTYCFPSPWCGSSGVQFIGSSTNYNGNPTDTSNCSGGDWDGGAILVTNTGETKEISLINLTVVFPLPASGDRGTPSCAQPPRPITFDLWFGQQYYFGNKSDPAYVGSPIVLPPGGQAIFAGTSSDGSYTCPTGNYPSAPPKATYDFDTSDANFLNGCTPTNDTVSDPQITFTALEYAPTTYIDEGHTLDTGGIDVGNCSPTAADPQWGHEDMGWRLVNSTCGVLCPSNQFGGATSVVTVAASTTTVTGPATTVTVTSTSGEVSATTAYGISAVAVVFIVTTGYLAMRRRKPAS